MYESRCLQERVVSRSLLNAQVYHTSIRNAAEGLVVDSHQVVESILVLGFCGDGDAAGRNRVLIVNYPCL